MKHGVGALIRATVWDTTIRGDSYRNRAESPTGSQKCATVDVSVRVCCSVLMTLRGIGHQRELLLGRGRCPVEENIWSRVSTSLTGRRTSRAATAHSTTCIHRKLLDPKAPPTRGDRIRCLSSGCRGRRRVLAAHR